MRTFCQAELAGIMERTGMTAEKIRTVFEVRGVVQGVGFRPAVYRLAKAQGLSGSVRNCAGAVRLTLEGTPEQIRSFLATLRKALPPRARLDSVCEVSRTPLDVTSDTTAFTVEESIEDERHEAVLTPDLRMCEDCAREIQEETNRRYSYVFTTCTNCGPRYTILRSLPFDRRHTTMATFPLCEQCEAEYHDPANRRFHAETIACPHCGPHLFLEDMEGTRLGPDPLQLARKLLAAGHIVAVRGIGGYVLAADAFNRQTLATLRTRKQRPHKPFAVMAPDLATLEQFCVISQAAREALTSPQGPIVILDVRHDQISHSKLPLDLITPDSATLGCMLPTSPLHQLLLEPLPGDPVPTFPLLIMTSANRGGEPICVTNDEAHQRLRGIADYILGHNREISLRNDDSVCVIRHGQLQVWRRARGFAPAPLGVPWKLQRSVLALGAELKNAIAFGYEDKILLSPHIGDLETPEALHALEEAVHILPRLVRRQPQAVVVDLHPDMHSTIVGYSIATARGIPLVSAQHHHAHALACLGEHGEKNGLALVFDGTGLGPDGTIWGAELLEVEGARFRRLATFRAVPLPGGDAAIRRPARQLIARFALAGVPMSTAWLNQLGVSEQEAIVWTRQALRGLNAPASHAAGRLFDSFSCLLGFSSHSITYDGQPAVRLETAARCAASSQIPEVPFAVHEIADHLEVDWSPAFAQHESPTVIAGREKEWALAFHHAVVRAALAMLDYALAHSSHRSMALSGGVFMNRLLSELLIEHLEQKGLRVLIHRETPPNDGCIAFGQVLIGGEPAH
ncbi:MAG: carbamoyltransferase HypF [Kiritimatiellia bacterium]